jgi:hypothetical protein
MRTLWEAIQDDDEQVDSRNKYTLLATDPEYFAREYLKCRDHGYLISEREGVKYLSVHSCGAKEMVIDQRFPYALNFKISSITSPMKIVIKDWNRFKENFQSQFPTVSGVQLGGYLSKFAGMNVKVQLQDPDASYDQYSFNKFEIHGQLVFDKAKSVNFSVLPKVEGDIVFHKKGIGVLNIPFMNGVRSVTIKD